MCGPGQPSFRCHSPPCTTGIHRPAFQPFVMAPTPRIVPDSTLTGAGAGRADKSVSVDRSASPRAVPATRSSGTATLRPAHPDNQCNSTAHPEHQCNSTAHPDHKCNSTVGQGPHRGHWEWGVPDGRKSEELGDGKTANKNGTKRRRRVGS